MQREAPWQPDTFYGLANGELFVEHSFVNALRFMFGAGYIKSDRVRIELNYVAELSRSASTDPFAYTDNSFRLDFKFSLREGLHHKQEGPESVEEAVTGHVRVAHPRRSRHIVDESQHAVGRSESRDSRPQLSSISLKRGWHSAC